MIEKLEQFWNDWLNGLQASSTDKQYDHGDWQRSKVLLVFQVPIRREEDFVSSGRKGEEFAVLDARPTSGADSCDLVPCDQWRKILR